MGRERSRGTRTQRQSNTCNSSGNRCDRRKRELVNSNVRGDGSIFLCDSSHGALASENYRLSASNGTCGGASGCCG